jgi:hypothetical protein
MHKLPDQQYLRQKLIYNPETGILRWTERPYENGWNPGMAGKVAGTRTKRGYIFVKIDGVQYLAHRLIWKWMTGLEPGDRIDHRNGIKYENWWDNLREATPRQNQANMKMHKDNRSGFKGASFHKGKFASHISIDGKSTYLGRFNSAEEANAAYFRAAIAHFGEFANAGTPETPP